MKYGLFPPAKIQNLGNAVSTNPFLLKLTDVMVSGFPLIWHVQVDDWKKHAVYKAISKAGLVPIKKLLPGGLLAPPQWNLALTNAG